MNGQIPSSLYPRVISKAMEEDSQSECKIDRYESFFLSFLPVNS